MIAFLLNLYILAVWLVYFKFKWLKFDAKNKVAVGVLGVLFVFGLLMVVNFLHPMTLDARVMQHIVEIAPRVPAPARVVEVPVAPNKPLKKGDVLFRLDARPYEYEVQRSTAAVAAAEQSVPQLKAQLAAAEAAVERIDAERKLAQITLDRNLGIQNRNAGAISQQEVDESREQVAASEAGLRESQAQVEAARAGLDLSDQTIAQANAELAAARLNLEETTVTAPADGFVTVMELRPGFVVAPGQAVMSFVSAPEGVVGATFAQEYAAGIKPGDEAEICLDVYPGKTLRGKVETVIRATGEGQLAVTGMLPTTSQKAAAARIPVKIILSEEDQQRYAIPAGASGAAAVYTDRGTSFQIVRRVMIRWYTWLNYLKMSL